MIYWKRNIQEFPFDDINFDIYVKKENKKTIEYINLPIAFDIETSSFKQNDEYKAIMYHWQIAITPNYVVLGRDWDGFHNFINALINAYNINLEHRCVIYVHNLMYEFSFIKRRFNWDTVFSIQNRRPIYAVTTSGIEFRCSYLLSGMSLERIGESLTKYSFKKLVGNLDYQKIRHSKTPMSVKEHLYCVNDVKVLSAYIDEIIEKEGSIIKIPLTKTGYVRRDCREVCLTNNHKSKQYKKYRELMKFLQLRTQEYDMLKCAFQGGFTHANAWYVNTILNDIESKDFTSSYPTIMACEKFPMSYGKEVHPTYEEFKEKQYLYCWCLEVEFFNVQSKISYEHYISESRCYVLSKKHDTDNGRIVSAEHLIMTITEQDFYIIENAYTWDNINIKGGYRYKKGYLPTPLVKKMLEYYELKTTLKGVKGQEDLYLLGKERVNSIYGMMVQDAVQELIEYDENDANWHCEENFDKEIKLDKYNRNYRRFSYYPWGVWVTAYARRNLWTGIFECGNDYVYSDTDSIKILNANKHVDYFKKYNEWILKRLEKAMRFHNIDISKISPKTIEGIEKPLGVWDYDGTYTRFKTLGAKRYMVEYDNGDINLTVSGLNKKKAIPYLLDKYGKEKIFDAFKASDFFNEGLVVPKEYSGRLTMSYVDFEIQGNVKDYRGHTAEYHELSCVHSDSSTFEMSYGKDFINYLMGIREEVFK